MAKQLLAAGMDLILAAAEGIVIACRGPGVEEPIQEVAVLQKRPGRIGTGRGRLGTIGTSGRRGRAPDKNPKGGGEVGQGEVSKGCHMPRCAAAVDEALAVIRRYREQWVGDRAPGEGDEEGRNAGTVAP